MERIIDALLEANAMLRVTVEGLDYDADRQAEQVSSDKAALEAKNANLQRSLTNAMAEVTYYKEGGAKR